METEGAGPAYRSTQTRDCQGGEEARTHCSGNVGPGGARSGVGEGRIGEEGFSEKAGERQGSGNPRCGPGEREIRTPASAWRCTFTKEYAGLGGGRRYGSSSFAW